MAQPMIVNRGITARCLWHNELCFWADHAHNPEGLAEAETTTDPAARAWVLRNALDAAIQALPQDDPLTKLPDE